MSRTVEEWPLWIVVKKKEDDMVDSAIKGKEDLITPLSTMMMMMMML